MCWTILYFRVVFDCDYPILEALWIVALAEPTTKIWRDLDILCAPTCVDLDLHWALKVILRRSYLTWLEKRNYMSVNLSKNERICISWTDYESQIAERYGQMAILIECSPPYYNFFCFDSPQDKIYLKTKQKPMSLTKEMVIFSQHFKAYRVLQNPSKLSEFLRPLLN